jgi:hypothetical protein
MERSRVNFIVDAAMLLCGSVLSGIGFLMKFVLIPGKERFAMYGSNVDLFFLGLDRHEWGTVHLLIAFLLFALLVTHILLHLRLIVNVASGMIAGQWVRKIAAALFVLLCLLCMLFAFVVRPDVREGAVGEGRGGFGKGRMEHRLRN